LSASWRSFVSGGGGPAIQAHHPPASGKRPRRLFVAATETRRISCSGRDIYAVTAPIVVEGAIRLLDGRHRGPGAMAPGEAFDAGDLLVALERDTDGLAVRRDWPLPPLSVSGL
jgi:hypothetical protein